MDHRNLWDEYAPTARGAQEHFEDLGLNIEDLRGKKILDIGAGLNKFANELKDEKLDIVSLDPFYALSREEKEKLYQDHLYEDGDKELTKLLDQLDSEDRSSKLVAGRSENLPFANESFDLIISHYGSPFYGEDGEKIGQFFSELDRVLKNGGEARLYPIWVRVSDLKKSAAVEKSLREFEEGGYDITKVGSAWIIRKPPKMRV